MSKDPAPARTNRAVHFLVAALVLAAAVAGTAALRTTGVLGGVDPAITASHRAVAERFLTALKADDLAAARRLSCPPMRASVSDKTLREGFGIAGRAMTSYELGEGRTRETHDTMETSFPLTLRYDKGRPRQWELRVLDWNGEPVFCGARPAGSG